MYPEAWLRLTCFMNDCKNSAERKMSCDITFRHFRRTENISENLNSLNIEIKCPNKIEVISIEKNLIQQIKLNYEIEEKRDIEKDISTKKLKVQLLI